MKEELKSKTNKRDNPNIDFTRVMANKEAYFTPSQIQKIIDYYFHRKEYQKFLLFLMLFRTGRRISEILGKPPYSFNKKQCLGNYKGFRPCDIYHQDRLIEFDILKKQPIKHKTKSGEERSKDKLESLYNKKRPRRKLKPIDDELYNWLVWYIDNNKIQFENRVFDVSRFTARNWLIKACNDLKFDLNLGFKNVKVRGNMRKVRVKPHLHMFRHSMAIYVLKNNPRDPTALIKVSNLLEHSNTEITTHYTQFTQKDIKEFLNKTFGGNKYVK